jgi:pimeloyl-ACP methyl ester carboxylesterase
VSQGGTPESGVDSRAPIDAGDGPVVVLVHGQPGAGGDWAALAGELATDHRVLAPNRPGWGSDPRPAVGIAANAEALEDLLRAVVGEARVTVVGHSLGGGVALELALLHKERVGALVLVGSVGVAGALSGFDRLLVVPMLGSGLVRAGVAALRRGLITAARYPKTPPGARVARKVAVLPTLQAAIGTDGRPIIGRSRRSFLIEQRALLAETPGLERSLGRIEVPVAVVTGTSDRIVPVAAARALAERLPRAELIVMTGGHLLPFEQPWKVAQVVRRYVALAGGLKDAQQPRGTPEA